MLEWKKKKEKKKQQIIGLMAPKQNKQQMICGKKCGLEKYGTVSTQFSFSPQKVTLILVNNREGHENFESQTEELFTPEQARRKHILVFSYLPDPRRVYVDSQGCN